MTAKQEPNEPADPQMEQAQKDRAAAGQGQPYPGSPGSRPQAESEQDLKQRKAKNAGEFKTQLTRAIEAAELPREEVVEVLHSVLEQQRGATGGPSAHGAGRPVSE